MNSLMIKITLMCFLFLVWWKQFSVQISRHCLIKKKHYNLFSIFFIYQPFERQKIINSQTWEIVNLKKRDGWPPPPPSVHLILIRSAFKMAAGEIAQNRFLHHAHMPSHHPFSSGPPDANQTDLCEALFLDVYTVGMPWPPNGSLNVSGSCLWTI